MSMFMSVVSEEFYPECNGESLWVDIDSGYVCISFSASEKQSTHAIHSFVLDITWGSRQTTIEYNVLDLGCYACFVLLFPFMLFISI